MANICNYEVRVIGSKNAGLFIYAAMPSYDDKELVSTIKAGSQSTTRFTGDCKWSVDFDVQDQMDPISLTGLKEDQIIDLAGNYSDRSLRAKSEALICEILVHSWSSESEYDRFEHYKNGNVLKKRKIAYDPANVFDWKKTEFKGHAGKYDESVDGDTAGEDMMGLFYAMERAGLGKVERGMRHPPSSGSADKGSTKTRSASKPTAKTAEKTTAKAPAKKTASRSNTLYSWSFDEGKTVRGNGWTIAIPDGFKRIDSQDRVFESKRIFELVPEKYSGSESRIPVRILPGNDSSGSSFAQNWMCHPNALAGLGAIHGSMIANLYAEKMNADYAPLYSCGFGNVYAFILIHNTFDTYSFQASVETTKRSIPMRIQTGVKISDPKKHDLLKSMLAWLQTMCFDDPEEQQAKTPLFDDPVVLNELMKQGKTDKFEEAVEEAKLEYGAATNGRLKAIEYMAENGLLDEYAPEDCREILQEAMDTRLFFLEKADRVVTQLSDGTAKIAVIKKVLKKLHELDEDFLTLTVDNVKISVGVPDSVNVIRERWEALEKTGKLPPADKGGATSKAKYSDQGDTEVKNAQQKPLSEPSAGSADALDMLDSDFRAAASGRQNKLESTERDADALKAEIAELKSKINSLKKGLAGKEREIDELISEINLLTSLEADPSSRIRRIEQKLKEQKREKEAEQGEDSALQEAAQKLTSWRNTIADMEQKLARTQTNCAETERKLQEIEKQLADLQGENERILSESEIRISNERRKEIAVQKRLYKLQEQKRSLETDLKKTFIFSFEKKNELKEKITKTAKEIAAAESEAAIVKQNIDAETAAREQQLNELKEKRASSGKAADALKKAHREAKQNAEYQRKLLEERKAALPELEHALENFHEKYLVKTYGTLVRPLSQEIAEKKKQLKTKQMIADHDRSELSKELYPQLAAVLAFATNEKKKPLQAGVQTGEDDRFPETGDRND